VKQTEALEFKMIATLPMYDLPGLRAATDAWWTGLAGHLRARGVAGVPDALTRDAAPRERLWRSPDLMLSQTCGYPLVHGLDGVVGLIATPRHVAPGCAGALYSSLIVIGADTAADRLGISRMRRPRSTPPIRIRVGTRSA
jgi:hypothetical protein